MLAAATPPIVRRSPPTSAAFDLRRPIRAFRAAVGVAVVAMLVAAPAGARVAPEAALSPTSGRDRRGSAAGPVDPRRGARGQRAGTPCRTGGRSCRRAGGYTARGRHTFSHRERDEDVRRRRGPPPGGGPPRRPRPCDRALPVARVARDPAEGRLRPRSDHGAPVAPTHGRAVRLRDDRRLRRGQRDRSGRTGGRVPNSCNSRSTTVRRSGSRARSSTTPTPATSCSARSSSG